ncbi:MAG: FlgD immunoglobulin-like domain containing protein, partial [Armatimonadota bacterium]
YWDEFLSIYHEADYTPPAAPVLAPIDNPDGIGDYTLTWGEVFDASGIDGYRVCEYEPPNLLLSDSAEGGSDRWILDGFSLSTARAYNGSYSYFSGAANDLDNSMVLRWELAVPTAGTASLSYWIWYDIEYDWDYAYVDVSSDGGSAWDTLAVYTGDGSSWQQHTHSLDDYAGQSILVRFRYVTDYSIIYEGAYFDHIVIKSQVMTESWDVAPDQTQLEVLGRPWGVWHYTVQARDGAQNWGDVSESQYTAVTNHAPTLASVQITPDPAYTDSDLTATPEGFQDDDGDPEGYVWAWERDVGDGFEAIGGADTDSLGHEHFERGDVIRVTCRPDDGRGERAVGAAVTDEVQILNTPPTAPTVDVTPDAPGTEDELSVTASDSTDSDNDSVSYTYAWYRNGERQADYDDQTAVPASATARGHVWKCVVTPSDGSEDGTAGEDYVTVGNTPPSAPDVTISPADPGPFDDLQCTIATESEDPDGDDVTYAYEWQRIVREGAPGATRSASVLSASETSIGEVWRCVVTPSDGHNDGSPAQVEVTIADTDAPTKPTSCTISPAEPTTADDLSASAEGSDAPSGGDISYEYQWRKSSDGGETWSEWGGDEATLEQTAKDERWQARARAFDGVKYSGWTASAAVTILNSPPSSPSRCELSPEEPRTQDDLTPSAAGSDDPDAEDVVSYEYQYRSSSDGGDTWSAWGNDGSSLPNARTAAGETWQARARGTDGEDASGWVKSSMVYVHGVSIISGPTGDPDPVPSLGQVQCTVTAEDSRGHDVAYHWTAEDAQGDAAGSFDDAGTREPTWTAPENTGATEAEYTLMVTVTCTQDSSVSAMSSFVQRVTPVPHRVTISAGPAGDPNPVASGGNVSCSATAEDSRGHDVLYQWAAEDADGKPVGSFDDATTQNPTWTAPANTNDSIAEYTITVTAACAEDSSVTATESFVQQVSPVPHTVTISEGPEGAPNPVVSGGEVACSVTAEDSRDGHTLSYEWSAVDGEGTPVGSFDDATAQNPTWTAPAEAGDYEITVIVECDRGESTTASFTQQVLPSLAVTLGPGWNMISLGQPRDRQATIRELLGPKVLALFRWDASRFGYDPVDMNTEVAASCEGYGFWALCTEALTREFTARAPAVADVACERGWNLLGNPHPTTSDLETCLLPEGSGRLVFPAYHWDGRKYISDRSMPAGCGFWVLSTYSGSGSFQPMGMATSPAQEQTTSLADAPDLAEGGMWIQLAAEAGDKRDACTWIGMSADGTVLKTPKPPMMPGAVGAYLDVEDGIGYGRCIVPESERHTWTLTVNSPEQDEVSLRIVDTSQLPGDMAVWLTDKATEERIDLRHAPGYTYTARGGQRRFEIELGERHDLLGVMGVSAQPAGEGAQISFTLSAAGSVSVDVLNIAGRTIKRIVTDWQCQAGLRTVSWDGRSDQGTRAPGGMYLVRVTASAPSGEQCQGLSTLPIR